MGDIQTGDGESPATNRGWTAIAALVLVVIAYAVVALFYNAEGGLRVTGAAGPGASGLAVHVEPVALDPQLSRASVHLTFSDADGSLTDGSGRLTENTRVVIGSGGDTQELRFPAGSVPGQADVAVWMSGELATYPFDTYDGRVFVTVDTYQRNGDGTFTSTGAVAAQMVGLGGVNGWDTSLDIMNLPGSAEADIHMSRAFSSQVFALMLLLLATLLSVSALVVGLLVYEGRRRLEVALMSWTASLLFALPLLRNFMPNSPPIGASIDIYVYLWVMVAAIIGALLVVITWVRQSRTRPGATNAS